MNNIFHKNTVVFVTPYFPPHGGGLEQYARAVAIRLQRDHARKIVVITSGTQYGRDEKTELDGLTVYRLGFSLKISNTPLGFLWPWKLRRIMREEAPDLVNVHTPVPGIGDIAARCARSVPLVVTYHAGSMQKGKTLVDWAIKLYERGPMRWMLNRADHIICASDFVRKDFLREYLHKSTTVTPGVEAEQEFEPQPELRSLHPSIVFVAANLDKHKGLDVLLDALVAVRTLVPSVKLSVVGGGSARLKYEALVRKKGLNDCVVFTGHLSGKTLVREFQKAWIFALPTDNDNSPMVVTEAMSAGLPVVSTMVGGIPSMVETGKTGFLIAPHDLVALAEKISILLSDSGMAARFGAAGRDKAISSFSWKERVATYHAVLERVLQQKAKPLFVHVAGYYPPHMGGMEQRVQELVTLLAGRGEKVRVYTSSIGARATKEIQQGVTVFYLRTIEFAHTPITLGIVYRLLTLPRGSVLHLHVAQAFFPEMVWLAAKLRGFPYVAHIRLLLEVPSGFFGILLPIYSKIVLGPILRGAQKIIVLTPGYQDILYKRFGIPQEKIVVIPNATTFTRVSKPRQDIHTPLRILAVGRISVQKNYPLMFEVAAHLKKEFGLDFTLTIVGTGDSRAEMEAQVRALEIESAVEFRGEVRGEPLQKIYEESDLFVHTAFVESFGTVLIEAMAKGLPIVAANVIGVRDVIQHERNGLLCFLSIEDISRAVMRLVNDSKLYADLSANNLRDVEKYNWDAIVDQTLAVYKALTP